MNQDAFPRENESIPSFRSRGQASTDIMILAMMMENGPSVTESTKGPIPASVGPKIGIPHSRPTTEKESEVERQRSNDVSRQASPEGAGDNSEGGASNENSREIERKHGGSDQGSLKKPRLNETVPGDDSSPLQLQIGERKHEHPDVPKAQVLKGNAPKHLEEETQRRAPVRVAISKPQRRLTRRRDRT